MVRVLITTAVLVMIAITPAALRSFAEGPFPGFTGGFGEPTCQQCPFGGELNPAGGRLSLTGIPDVYAPGATYTATVTLAKAGLVKGGFQLSARVATGEAAGRNAGALEPGDKRIQVVTNQEKTVTYVQHTPAGTRAATPGSLSWTFRWTAPAGRVAVRFNVAANASNGDESPLDDSIYSLELTTKPGD